jgi:hypothetical protein
VAWAKVGCKGSLATLILYAASKKISLNLVLEKKEWLNEEVIQEGVD